MYYNVGIDACNALVLEGATGAACAALARPSTAKQGYWFSQHADKQTDPSTGRAGPLHSRLNSFNHNSRKLNDSSKIARDVW